jgi:hypothetical protein
MSQLVGAVRGDARHDIAQRVNALAAERDRPVAALCASRGPGSGAVELRADAAPGPDTSWQLLLVFRPHMSASCGPCNALVDTGAPNGFAGRRPFAAECRRPTRSGGSAERSRQASYGLRARTIAEAACEWTR